MVKFSKSLDGKSQDIFDRATLRAKKYLVAESELLESIIEIDKDKTYLGFGETHLTPFCVKYLRLSEDVAGMFIRVARKTYQVPELKAAIDAGQISMSNARTVVSVINQENKDFWIEKAETLSKRNLEREVAAASPIQRKESIKPSGGGFSRLELDQSYADSDQFRRCQELVSRKLKREATISETLKHMMDEYQDRHDPVRKADRAQKSHPSRDGSAVTHAVNLRDRDCCQAELPDGTKCGSSKWTHHHHIIPREFGGEHTPENITTLCSTHHRMHHRREDQAFRGSPSL